MKTGSLLAVGGAALLGLALVLGVTAAVLSTLVLGTGPVAPGSAAASVPTGMLERYQAAAATCPGLPWTVLAAIGTVESGNGTSMLAGVHSGANPAGAEGPMQFEPATFARYSVPAPPGGALPATPYDATDAVYAAARLLCANGGRSGADLPGAVFTYNHSSAYVAQVLTLANAYGGLPGGTAPAAPGGAPAGSAALAWAVSQIGTPYVWGGETPGRGFDCSGLVQAAYRAAGVALPRVAQDQFDAGPAVPAGQALEPGDLVFFGTSPSDVSHVGIVSDPAGRMVDAPFTGASVRVDDFPTVPGVAWGADRYVGATRPGT